MFCSECGLEIQGKRIKRGEDTLCSSCNERHTKKIIEHRSKASDLILSNAQIADEVANDMRQRSPRANGNDLFSDEAAYLKHVQTIRSRFVLPRLLLLGVLFFFLSSFIAVVDQGPGLLIFILVFTITFVVIYFKYFLYKPELENLVIVSGIVKKRIIRSKNDDLNYKLTELSDIQNLHLIPLKKNQEIHLCGIPTLVNPYINQRVTFYVDAKLKMILACKS